MLVRKSFPTIDTATHSTLSVKYLLRGLPDQSIAIELLTKRIKSITEISPVVVVIVIYSLLKRDLVNGCPSSCFCTGTEVNCLRISLDEIPANIPLNTTYLDLSGNYITTVGPNALSGFTSLTELDLSGNEITTVGPSALSGLTSLQYCKDLAYNDITTVGPNALSGLTSLTELDLEHNKLVSLPEDLLSSNTNLKNLDLESNKLESLPEGLLTMNTNLQNLDLRNNSLVCLPKDLLSSNTNLEKLDLTNNNLVSLPKDLLSSNTNLKTLYLAGNPFICCLMIEFREWASNQTQLNYFGECTVLDKTEDIDIFDTEDCIIPAMVNGGWCPWFNSSCSVTCGDGVIIKTRTCDNPPPSDGGLNCDGSKTETSHCNLGKCPESCSHSKKGSNNK
ncbi:unnamed protein product [Mytilus coruscus]|uniref:LRRNT domain-containing protein n=1 Tax=Mytilus coruscus TaxID=42192 RepID=A0A6J8CHA0_MYTCO|nr:unnamed protein product [Mytilus coruscus]